MVAVAADFYCVDRESIRKDTLGAGAVPSSVRMSERDGEVTPKVHGDSSMSGTSVDATFSIGPAWDPACCGSSSSNDSISFGSSVSW